MDIMGPSIQEQTSPAPWLKAEVLQDRAQFVQRLIRTHPDWSADDIVRELAQKGIQVSGILVASAKQDMLRRGQ